MIGEFLRWWRGQLLDLVPDSLKHHRYPHTGVHRLELSGELARFFPEGREPPLVIPLTGEAASTLPDGVTRPTGILDIRLPPSEYLLIRIRLPQAARGHLDEAVRYQLPRLVPFTIDQIHHTYGIESEAKDDDQLPVWVIVIPRTRLDRALTGLGLNPDALQPDLKRPPEPGEPLSFHWKLPQQDHGGIGRRRVAIAIMITAIAGPALLHLYNRYSEYRWLQEQLDRKREQATETLRLLNYSEGIARRVHWLNEQKKAAVSPLDVLETLSRNIGDDTWLQTLEMKGDRLTIQGLSPAPGQLIKILEEIPLFDEVRFESAITRDARQGLSRFTISAKLASGISEANQ